MVRAATDVEKEARRVEIEILVKSVIDTVRQMPSPHDHRTIVKAMKRTIPADSISHDMWVEVYEDSLETLLQAVTASVAGKKSEQLSFLPATPRFTAILAATPSGRPMIVGKNYERLGARDRQIIHDR